MRGANAGTVLLLVVAVGLGVVAGILGAPALAVLAPLFVGVCAVWPAAGVAALIAACALDRFAVSVGGPNVRPDELAALALAAALVLRTALTPRATLTPRRRGPGPEGPWQGTDLKRSVWIVNRRPHPRPVAGQLDPSGSVPAMVLQGQDHAHHLAATRDLPSGSVPAMVLQGQALPASSLPQTFQGPSPAMTFQGPSPAMTFQGQAAPGQAAPGQAAPGQAAPGQAASGQAARVPLLLPLLAYLAVNMLSTLTSADPARGLSLDLITLDLMVLYAVLALTLSTPARLLWGVRIWLGVAAVEAVAGMLAFALYLTAHAAVPGVQLDIVSGAPLVYGTLYEGNIFGSYMSAAFLIALALVADETARHRGLLYLVLAASAVGLLLSGTRSAWGATVIGALALLVLLRLGRGGRRGRLLVRLVGGLVAVGLVVGVGLTVLPASVTGAFGTRAQGLLNFGSGSGYGRVQLYKVAIDEWQAHPLLGVGPGSFTYRLPGDYAAGPAWLPNLTLQALHDTGILGLLALLWLVAAFYITTIGALRRAPPGEARAALAGLVAAVTALLIAFQLTPGFQLGYTWALLAFGVAASRAVAGAREGRVAGDAVVAA